MFERLRSDQQRAGLPNTEPVYPGFIEKTRKNTAAIAGRQLGEVVGLGGKPDWLEMYFRGTSRE